MYGRGRGTFLVLFPAAAIHTVNNAVDLTQWKDLPLLHPLSLLQIFTNSILYFQHYLLHHSASSTYAICSYLCNLTPHGQIFWERWCSPCGGTSLPASRQFKYEKRKQPTLADTQLARTQLKFAPLPGSNADPILSPNHFLRITFSDKPRP